MLVLDLCTEFASETAAFRDRGHEVVTLGIEGNVDIICDVRQYFPSVDDKYDFIIAHPPCTEFSLAMLNPVPCKDRHPDLSIVEACQRIIATIKPTYWLIENPRACLRYFIGKPQYTIKYSDYGHICCKPTDLWGNVPMFQTYSPNDKTIDFAYAYKSSGKVRQKERALVPYGLSLALCKAIERDMEQE